MRHYVTLFNMKYAAKGMALYESLAKHSSEPFQLWVVAMDEETAAFLESKKALWPHMVVLEPSLVFSSKFAKAVLYRDVAYTCFTATPWVMAWCLEHLPIDEITYLDSDVCFYADPEIAHREIGGRSVAIVPHRFQPHDVERLSPNGWFNVSWVTIKQDMFGAPILARWRAQCLEKCDRQSCGDQTYLDQWPELLSPGELCIFDHHGVGVAPWNAAAYHYVPGPQIQWHEGTGFGAWSKAPVVFYHFHELKRKAKDDYTLTGYPLPDSCKDLIYKPYIIQLELGEDMIAEYERTRHAESAPPQS